MTQLLALQKLRGSPLPGAWAAYERWLSDVPRPRKVGGPPLPGVSAYDARVGGG
ncbi:hypothetical protein ACNKF0_11360 [Nocardioides sp. T5]|uniref:hypothetical protein n=1 Tax=Nocardioides sp. T5 TaxID=3400182 RepID=UPI003A876E7D